MRTYSELRQIPTFEGRYKYLVLGGVVGDSTFGFNRDLNQDLYHSSEWRRARQLVIVRDGACDLGIEGYEIYEDLYIHHMNPLTVENITHAEYDALFNPEYLITVTHRTHNAIHYGDESQLPRIFTPRSPGDTKLW